MDHSEKLKLYGFNNLTKALSFNIYDVCYAKTPREQKDYIAYIDEQYNSERLTKILCDVTEKIGATVLNISKQDYDPQGASVNVLFAEGYIDPDHVDESCNKGAGYFNRSGIQPNTVHAHLDKSHITVHTFPEYHPDKAISTFRVDIDVATCGEISPLNTLDYLHSGLHRSPDPDEVRRYRRQCVPVEYIPYKNADQGDRASELSLQFRCLRDPPPAAP